MPGREQNSCISLKRVGIFYSFTPEEFEKLASSYEEEGDKVDRYYKNGILEKIDITGNLIDRIQTGLDKIQQTRIEEGQAIKFANGSAIRIKRAV